MVSCLVGIGIRKFSSIAEADRYYHAILHRTEAGNEVAFKEAKDVLFLALHDGTILPLLGKRFCNVVSVRVIANKFRKKVFCIVFESGESQSLSLSGIFSNIRKNAAKNCKKKLKKICRKKERLPLTPQDIWNRHLNQFRDACRKVSYNSEDKPKIEGLEAHHANPGGLAFIINSFIVLNSLDFQNEVASHGIILDTALREKFEVYHQQKVEWEMLDHETHLAIHQKKN